jgi:tungstate transport system substrate-binding protein
MMKRIVLTLLSVVPMLFTWNVANADSMVLRLSTTTSTQNSGLLDDILPKFEKSTGYKVHVIAVGTGKALRMGKDGDADVLLVHAPPAEKKFMAGGNGVNRRYVMYNDFVIVGPKKDPAHIRGMHDALGAFRKIAQAQSLFISRGDDSGTNKKEKIFWKDIGIKPHGSWYRAAGQGMGKVLLMTDELQGYTLIDRGTWLAMKNKVDLKVLVQGDKLLFNPYHIMAVNPAHYPDVNYKGAMELISWITSVQGQRDIGDYRVHGKELFVPTAVPMSINMQQARR